MDKKEKAKSIIIEIIRQGDGVLTNKTNLYKAFYHAHLQYAKENPGLLSTWPIVRMPRGPGIHNCNRLLLELVAEGRLDISQTKFGNNTGFRFKLTDKSRSEEIFLTDAERCAIQFGTNAVIGKSSDQVSHDSHEQSPTWNDGANGKELPIYADLLSSEQYAEAKARAQRAAGILRKFA